LEYPLLLFLVSAQPCPCELRQMRWFSLPIIERENFYFMCPRTGTLMQSHDEEVGKIDPLPKKLKVALRLCNQPYSMRSSPASLHDSHKCSERQKMIAQRMLYISRINLFLARQYASYSKPFFNRSSDAIKFFHEATPSSDRSKLCLPRSLFAAKTSKSFNDTGVILIGVFLPSRQMHAWIIEDEQQADPLDNIWHLYRPVAAIC
jgi:hypothetical protein